MLVDRPAFLHRLELFEATKAATDHAEVGQGATDPALGDDRHSGSLPRVGDHAFYLFLRADPQELCAVGNEMVEEIARSDEAS